jgi:hypothetical protein
MDKIIPFFWKYILGRYHIKKITHIFIELPYPITRFLDGEERHKKNLPVERNSLTCIIGEMYEKSLWDS